MKFIVAADTDIGISKPTNQDSICVKIAQTKYGQAALILICDGMGGLSKGELASATVIRSFSDWFENDFPNELNRWNWENIANIIDRRLKDLNLQMLNYGKGHNVQIGTTVTGMLMIRMQYMTFHIGDTRIYKISDTLQQLTKDQTFFERDLKPLIESNKMTMEQAMMHPKRNALLQCVGASRTINTEIKYGNLENGINYIFCSDGFRHVLKDEELFKFFNPKEVTTKKSMQTNIRSLIEIVKQRQETDNISVIMVRPEA